MRKLKYKVLYLTNIPSPYMVGYLAALSKYVELHVVFEKGYDTSRPDTWKRLLNSITFNYIILKGKSISARYYGDNVGSAPDDKAFSPSVIKFINNNYDFIIVANPCTPTGILEILYLRLMHIPYSIQSEGGIPGMGQGFKERLKFFLMNKAEYFFSTCQLDDSYFYKYGASKDRIKRYPFASISESDLPLHISTEREKQQMKDKLGITTKWFILSVGRSVPIKGFDVLLKSIPNIREHNLTIGIVGGECIEDYKEIISSYEISNVFFRENVEFVELKNYYIAADIFVLPTRGDTWGLVINEAMTFGLPVITTDMCVAGNALIKDFENGFIVPTDNPLQIAEKINYLLNNPKQMKKMSQANFDVMRTWTFEEMARVMNKHIEEILE